MHYENPGVDSYKHYKDKNVYVIPTAVDVLGMEEALSEIARLVLKLASGDALSSASEDGYIPRGVRVIDNVDKPGKQRAIDNLTMIQTIRNNYQHKSLISNDKFCHNEFPRQHFMRTNINGGFYEEQNLFSY